MVVIALQGLALLLQIVAAILAFRLIRITGKSAAWTLLAVAFLLIVVRRSLTYARFFIDLSAFLTVDQLLESILLLVISICQLIGVSLIAPIFQTITQSEHTITQLNTALRQQNRAITMLSQVNQALVRATEETSLLQDVCHIIAKVGGVSTGLGGHT